MLIHELINGRTEAGVRLRRLALQELDELTDGSLLLGGQTVYDCCELLGGHLTQKYNAASSARMPVVSQESVCFSACATCVVRQYGRYPLPNPKELLGGHHSDFLVAYLG